jgi:hypothetical protein
MALLCSQVRAFSPRWLWGLNGVTVDRSQIRHSSTNKFESRKGIQRLYLFLCCVVARASPVSRLRVVRSAPMNKPSYRSFLPDIYSLAIAMDGSLLPAGSDPWFVCALKWLRYCMPCYYCVIEQCNEVGMITHCTELVKALSASWLLR